jgi:hypothetical protein
MRDPDQFHIGMTKDRIKMMSLLTEISGSLILSVQRFFFVSRRDCHPVNGSAQDLALQNSVLMTRFYQTAPPNPIYITRS